MLSRDQHCWFLYKESTALLWSRLKQTVSFEYVYLRVTQWTPNAPPALDESPSPTGLLRVKSRLPINASEASPDFLIAAPVIFRQEIWRNYHKCLINVRQSCRWRSHQNLVSLTNVFSRFQMLGTKPSFLPLKSHIQSDSHVYLCTIDLLRYPQQSPSTFADISNWSQRWRISHSLSVPWGNISPTYHFLWKGATLSASPLSAPLMSGGLSMQKQSWWYLSSPVLQRWIRMASSLLTKKKCRILRLSVGSQ